MKNFSTKYSKKSLAHVPSNCLPHYRLIKEVAKRPYLRVIPITYIPSRFYSWTSLIFCCLRYPTPLPPPSSIPKWLLTDWPRRRWSYTRRPRRAGFALHYTSTTTSRRCNAGGCISRSSEKDCSQLTDLDRDDTDNRHCLYYIWAQPADEILYSK